MRKFYIAALAAVSLFAVTGLDARAASSGTEGRVYTTGLTREQELQLQMQVEKLKQENTASKVVNLPVVTPETVDKAAESASKFADIGVAIGKGLASAAKELGVAVNEFAGTTVGKLTMFLVVWHFFGSMLVHLVAGTIVFFVCTAFWFYSYRKATIESITYTPVTPDSKRMIKTVKHREDKGGNITSAYFFMLLAIIITASIITFTW